MTAPMTPEELSAEDRRIMGSTEAAKLALIDRTKEWRALRQPVMANRAALNEIDAKEREARFQLANAAALWLWHEENPAPGVAQQPWHAGAPAKPWSLEWFIAETTYGDRVVLVALPDEWTYDFKTADDTYIKADKIRRWMQFPDSEFVEPAPPSNQGASK